MQHLYSRPELATFNGSPRMDIPSRCREYCERPVPYLGRLLIDLPHFTLDWTLHQDMRDMRRFRAVDLDGIQHEHAAPRELMRQVALIVPRYSTRND